MTKYNITLLRTLINYIEVEAEDEIDATEKALDMAASMPNSEYEIINDGDEVFEIEESEEE